MYVSQFAVDFTDFFRELVPLEYRKSAYIFNNSIIQLDNELYLMATRCHIPISYKFMNHSDIPIMWGSIGNIRDGWNAQHGYSMVALVKFPDNNFTNTPVYFSHRDLLPEYPTVANEDPRLYKKADGSIWLYTIGMDEQCSIETTKPENAICVYITERPILFTDGTFEIGNREMKRIPCAKGVLSEMKFDPSGAWFAKNWSPWVSDGSDFWTDFYPSYVIYEENKWKPKGIEGYCEKPQTQPRNLSQIANLKKYYSFTLNRRPSKLDLYAFSSTTPSIPVPQSILSKNKIFRGHSNVLAGVAHVRGKAKILFHNPEIMQAVINAMDKERNFYGSYMKFLEKLYAWNAKDLIYWHPDIYMMCVYFFDPEVVDGERGNFIATTDVFLPMIMNRDGTLASRFALAFPTGLMFSGKDIIITYGEGDTKTRLMHCPISALGMNKFDENYEKSLSFKVLELLGSNVQETRTVTDMLKTFEKH